MNRFCPICKADCYESCGLYDTAGGRCGIVTISGELSGIRNGLDLITERRKTNGERKTLPPETDFRERKD